MLNQLLNLIWLNEKDGGGVEINIYGKCFQGRRRVMARCSRLSGLHTEGATLGENTHSTLGHTSKGCWDVWSLELNSMLLLGKQMFSFFNQAPSLFPSLLKQWASYARMELHEGPFDRPQQGSLEAVQQLSVPHTEQQHWTGVLLPLSLELNPHWKPVTFCGWSLNANTWSHHLSWRCLLWRMTKYRFCFKPPSGIWCTMSF